jgi:chaperonin GroEL (HSP60 family)
MLMLLKECSLTEDIFPYFVTNSERMEVELEDPYILLYDKKVSSLNYYQFLSQLLNLESHC